MFAIEVPGINLDKIYISGQNLRWIKLKSKKYVIINGEKAVKVVQQKNKLLFNCSEEQFFEIWFRYFNLTKDYLNLMLRAKTIDFDIKVKTARSKGVRLLQFDYFESLVAAALISNGVKNIKGKLDLLSVKCGTEHLQSMREDGRISWFGFPTPEQILEKSKELKEQYAIMFNYKLKVLFALCQDVCSNQLKIDEFKTIKNKKELKSFLGNFGYFNEEGYKYLCTYCFNFNAIYADDKTIKDIEKTYGISNVSDFVDWFKEDLENCDMLKIILLACKYNYLNPPTSLELEKWERKKE